MIQSDNITFSYGRRQAPVLQDFSVSFDEGGIYGLLGKNGTGKSTLLYLLCGLLRPQSGRALLYGVDTKRRLPQTLEEIFIVPEEFELPAIRMKEYIALNRSFYPNFSSEVLQDCLQAFDLPEDIKLGSLSMGQKKKAYMSFALAAGTSVLLMDEPTNGLDIPSKSQFRKVVAKYATANRTIIISTHQVRDVESLLDHLVVMDGSRILLNASTTEVCERLQFEEREVGADMSDVLYAEPSARGVNVITRCRGEENTHLNLELLFNALLQNPALLDGGKC
ncbi:MAG: ATP-binding cassette domain-containing protein [Alloprevotella sp.]